MMTRAQQCDRKNANLRTRRQSAGNSSLSKASGPVGPRRVPAAPADYPLPVAVIVALSCCDRVNTRRGLIASIRRGIELHQSQVANALLLKSPG